MESTRFDELTRIFARPASRRRTLAGVVAAALAPLMDAAADPKPAGPQPAACLPVGKRCSQPAGAAGHGKGKHGKGKRHPPSCAKCCSRYGAAGPGGKPRCTCKSEGIACDQPAQCCSGQCRDNACTACPPGTVFCPDGCADLQTDANHCGACDHACGSGQRCQAGQCVCDAGSCPDGCCDAAGTCQRGTSDGACGAGGANCAICETPALCRQQACCMPDCAGKQCGDANSCGGVCDGPCANDCQTCSGGVCQYKPDGADCGGAGSGLHCCNGVCPPPPTCVASGSCCDPASTCHDCCSGGAGQVPTDQCASGWVCLVSGLHGTCKSDADCESGVSCQCGSCCLASSYNCANPSDCCSGTCNPSGTCA